MKKQQQSLLSRWDAIVRLYGQIAPRLDTILNTRHSFGLTDFLALRIIAGNWQPYIRIQQLAAELGVSHSAASRLVGKLEKVEILNRYECAVDRRGTYTAMTDIGHKALAKAEATYVTAAAQMMSSQAATELLKSISREK